jgi:antitoxin ParD1/3/4
MPSALKRTISLPAKQAEYVDSLVASGAYADESEVVQAGLEALKDRDAALEEWLVNEVVPVARAMEADPSRGIPIDEVFDSIRAHHEKLAKAGSK